MNGRAALAVFVKTPGLSPVKTRLAAAVGREVADEFYRLCLAAVEAVAREAAGRFGLRSVWAIAEAEGLNDDRWRAFDRIAQGTGGLGERLDRVYRTLSEDRDAVLLIGADAPLISVRLIGDALAAIGRSETPFAISRASDGGYALFAGRLPVPLETWLAVPYSSAETAEVFVGLLRNEGRVAELDRLDDIDTGEDLRRLAAVSDIGPLLPEQRAAVAFAAEQVARGFAGRPPT